MRFVSFTQRSLACALLLLAAACSRQPDPTALSARAPTPAAARPPLVLPSELQARLASADTRNRAAEDPAIAARLAHADTAALAQPFLDFADWLRAYGSTDADTRTDLLASGEEIARERRSALKTLLALDPELALRLALAPELRAALPAGIAAQLEQPLAAIGDLAVDISCGLPDGADHAQPHQDTITRTLTVGDVRYTAYTYGQRLAVSTKRNLPVLGIAIDDQAALADSGIRRLATDAGGAITYQIGGRVAVAAGEEEYADLIAAQEAWELAPGPDGDSAESPWSEGAKTMLYIRVAFADNPAVEPLALATAEANQVFVDTFYRDNSYGKTSLATTFTPLIVLPNDEAYYNGQSWTVLLADARAAALAAGYDSANFTFHTVATKKLSSMTWAGRAAIGGAYSHLNGDFALRVTAHEFGHNFGLYHANYNYTSGESPLSRDTYASAPENSPTQEYGHRYHMMGASGSTTAYHFSAREKQLLDWMPATDSPIILQSGTYRLYRHDHRDATSGVRSLRIPAGEATRAHFWLSHRKQFAPTTNNFGAGAEVLWGRPTNASGGTLLVDMTPFSNDGPHSDSSSADNSDKVDAALTEGRMFGSPDSGAWFTITGMGGTAPAEYLDVAVDIGNFTGNRPPTVALDAATATLALNAPLTLTATASDPDGDTVRYAWEFGDGTVGGNQPVANKSWNITGHYVVRVVATDNKGGTASARCVVRVGSPSTFTASGRVLANGLPVEGVRVFNGLTGSSYRGTRTDSAGYYTLPNLATGSYTLAARKEGYVFAPAFTNPADITATVTGLDFNATVAPAPYVIVDNTDPSGVELTGSWVSLNSANGFFAGDYLTDNNTGKGDKTATFRPNLPAAGLYRVYARYTQSTNRSTAVPIDISHEAGVNTFTLDQTQNGGLWNYLGTFSFKAGSEGYARVRNAGTTGHVAVDSFKFEATTTQDPTVRLVALQDTAHERGLAPALLRIEREGPLDFPLVVHLGTEPVGEASAVSGVDFVPLPASVTIPADADHYDLALTPLADALPEGDEGVALSLRPPPGPSQEWEFSDASGTLLTAAANSVEGGAMWTETFDSTSTTGGVLRVKRGSTGATSSWALLPNPNPTATQYYILESAAWALTGTSFEVIRFGFTTGANTTVTAQAVLTRTATGMTLAGDALGTGGTAIPAVEITTSVTTTEFYTFVVAVDPVAKTYTISYRRGTSGGFTSIGSGTIAPDRTLAAMRLSFTNSFATSTSEKFDVARIALTESDPTQPAYLITGPGSVEVTLKDDPRDDWRFRNFDPAALANGVTTAWDADPDGDGLTNLQEYAFNRRAMLADAGELTSAATVLHAGLERLGLTFERRTDDPGLLYLPEATGDLSSGNWPDAAVLHGAPQPSATDGYETVTFRDPVPLSEAARRFLRVRVELNP